MHWTNCINQSRMPIKAVEGHYLFLLNRGSLVILLFAIGGPRMADG